MKKFTLLLMTALLVAFVGCTPNEEPEPLPAPTISLEKVSVNVSTLSFKVDVTNATSAAWLVVPDGDESPTLETIMNSGELIDLRQDMPVLVNVENLEPSTDYVVVAAATNGGKTVGSNSLYVTTLELPVMELSVSVVQVDHEQMHFRVSAVNYEKLYWLVVYADREAPDTEYVVTNGKEITTDLKDAVAVTGLECDKEYQLLVVAKGNGQTLKHEPVLFKTEDDPDKVIRHEYTRAKGSKWGSNYYLMFSYEDANEAENFAYNEKTLGLDFYGDPEKDYLPAGVYEVKESTEPPVISSYRYSTYGYENGVKVKEGSATVTINEEEKTYRFDIDIYLLDGRHLVATYEGEVDGMPIVDKINLKTTFTKASAVMQDAEGWKYLLTLSDDAGNEAKLNLYNTFAAPYIVPSSYLNSTSADMTNQDFEAGEFDGTTSTFTVVGEGEGTHLFKSGSLVASVDWDKKVYTLSLFGTLANDVNIELGEYEGAIEGISLEPSTEVIEVALNKASARSYDSTNWYLTFSESVDGEDNYRLVLDTYCTAAQYLPAGSYGLGVGSGADGYFSDSSTLYVKGEGQYNFTSATLTVGVDMTAKTYSFLFEGKVQDGRTFKFTYNGTVSGMDIVEEEAVEDKLVWATAEAEHYFGTRWNLLLKSADENYDIDITLRNPQSGYIGSGTYCVKEDDYDDYAISLTYTVFKVGGVEKSLKDVTMEVACDEATKVYDLNLTLTLSDDTVVESTYSGKIAGSPEE